MTGYKTRSERTEPAPPPERSFIAQKWRHAVFDSTTAPLAKLTALAMLERSNEYGLFDDPHRVLEEMTGMSRRSVIRMTAELEAAGLLRRTAEVPGEPVVWALDLPAETSR